MRAVNLLPRDLRVRKSFREEEPALVVGAVLAVLVVIALAAGFARAHANVNTQRAQLADARASLAQIVAQRQAATQSSPVSPATPIVPVPSVTSEEQPRLQAVASVLATRIAWDRLLREFSLVVPSDVTVSSLTMKAPAPGAASGVSAQGFALSGLTFSHDSVARLLSRLMLIPDLADVTLANSTADPATGQVSFEIDASVKGAPVAATSPAQAPAPAATTTGATS
ncbi:MAG TPA: PilN domain-containing protein [Gaiellaceae bacterium]|nr:PilN domain-containing protein [Gaiellaceae bacterium]